MGQGIVMPPPPPGLGGGPGTVPPGGGPPPTTGIQPGPAGNVPQVSNERRPGLTYNTRVRTAATEDSPIRQFMSKLDVDDEGNSHLGIPFMDYVEDHHKAAGELQDVPMEEIERLHGEWPQYAPQYREAVAIEIASRVAELQEQVELATIPEDSDENNDQPLALRRNQELREGKVPGTEEEGEWIYESSKKVGRIDFELPVGKSKYSIVDPEAQPLEDESVTTEEESE